MAVVQIFEPREIPGKPWGREILMGHTKHYTLKFLVRKAGSRRGGLQYHRFKDETFALVSGECWVYYVDQDNNPQRMKMEPMTSIHVPPGAIHSVEAITDCLFAEASTPVFDDRVRVEDQYDLSQFDAQPADPSGNGPDTP